MTGKLRPCTGIISATATPHTRPSSQNCPSSLLGNISSKTLRSLPFLLCSVSMICRPVSVDPP